MGPDTGEAPPARTVRGLPLAAATLADDPARANPALRPHHQGDSATPGDRTSPAPATGTVGSNKHASTSGSLGFKTGNAAGARPAQLTGSTGPHSTRMTLRDGSASCSSVENSHWCASKTAT